MNNKGTVAIAVLLVIVSTGLVISSNIGFIKQGGDMRFKSSWTEQTKTNFRTIWCKMQNKGAEYCDGLRGK